MKPKGQHTGVIESFGYAFEGIAETFRQGRNIKIQTVVAVIAVVLGFAFQISSIEWIVMVLCIGLVLSGEVINTSFENVVDLACPEWHPKAKAAKDMAAGGVLVAAAMSLIIGLIIFVPKVLGALGWM